METKKRSPTVTAWQTFKSYYVVWKPDEASEYTTITISFKSYYVVWKLQYAYKVFPIFPWFKSYYVVWKPFEKTQNIVYQQ